MTHLVSAPLPCPACGHLADAEVPSSVNAGRSPEVRAALLAGRYLARTCAACGADFQPEPAFVYVDAERGEAALVRPPADAPAFEHWERVTERAFWGPARDAPDRWQRQAGRFALRTVFGLDALREKLLLWSAELDDPVVEVLKLDLRLRLPALRDRPLALRAVACDADALRFADAGDPATLVVAPRGRYLRLLAERAHLATRFPALFGRPYVDAARLAVD
ncbi:MAG: CpXC domain-containing protein [Myxococcales bacterium]|nr:CpXC domain-containing protein [Myxococcales bacterium]